MASAPQSQPAMEKALRPVYDPGSSAGRHRATLLANPLSPTYYGGLQAVPNGRKPGRRVRRTVLILTIGCLLVAAVSAFCSEATMKGPGTMNHRHNAVGPGPETSAVKLVFLGAIDVYRNRISPIQGQRCGFYPTCSSFSRQAVGEYGALQGVMMTTDRLTRCNIFKEPGPDYFLLPGGRLFDPVSANSLPIP
jgi:putative membrane protein insertion efficiency factor